jgi:N-acetylmuramoyl-L-alanine amidase
MVLAAKKPPTLLDSKCEYAPTPNTGGKRSETTLLVLHYSASNLFYPTVQWLCEPRAKASAHLVIGERGETAQLASLDAVCWHSGKSSWRDKSSCNGFSVGVEIVNLGPLLRKADGSFVSVSGGRKVPADRVFHGKHATDRNCPYEYWQTYTDAQIARVREVVALLRAKYPTIKDVVGHSDVSPGRKIDPGPALTQHGLLTAH